VRLLRAAFLVLQRGLASKNLVFLDEFGANLAMAPRYGRSPAGRRVYVKRPASRGKNKTFAGALTAEGPVAVKALPGSATVQNFTNWVREDLCPVLRPGQVVVMDNLRSHHREEVAALINARGASVLFIPPYSPEFNSIEECWSKIKSFLRKARARTEEALIEAVRMALETISSKDAIGWFHHAGYAL
jgi:transposase